MPGQATMHAMTALQRDPGRGHRPRLTRPTIIAVALGLARGEGIEALSMRRIADELDTGPMSLYRHVADRQDLLLAMLDEVARGVEVPAPAQDPRTEVEALVTAVHDALARDPWVVQVLVTEELASPLILPVVDRIFRALRTAGLSVRDTVGAYGLLFQFLYGEILNAHHHRGDASFARRMVRAADPDQFPAITEIVRSLPSQHPAAYFTDNLRHVLDGLLDRP